jgi:hypothetical protein
MYVRDVSVPQAVKEIITSNDLYLKAIKTGIANYTAIANKIQRDVEESTGTKVNVGTIVVAIKRFADFTLRSDSLLRNPQEDTNKVSSSDGKKNGSNDPHTSTSSSLHEAKLKLTGSIIDIDFGDQNFFKNIFEGLDELSDQKLFEYNLIRTEERVRLITEDMLNSRRLITSLTEKCHGIVTEGLSKITIKLFYNDTQGVRRLLSIIFEVLGNYKIGINNVFFTSDEIVLVIESDKATRAYDLIQKQVLRQ